MQGAALGGRDWQGILEAYHAVARRELARFCGREIETLEDSLCATFDGPARAVRCGCAISTRAQGLGRHVRVGVNAGELRLVGDRVEGAAVETAKRIATLAGAGEVVVSSTVKDLVSGSGIDLEDHGTRVLPSGSEGRRLFRAVPTGGARREVPGMPRGRAQPDSRPLSRREQEVATLIALGLSNRQIADELVIAETTAEMTYSG